MYLLGALFVVGLATDLWIFTDIPRDVGVNAGAATAGTVWGTSTRALYCQFGQPLQSLLSQQADSATKTFESDARALCTHLFGESSSPSAEFSAGASRYSARRLYVNRNHLHIHIYVDQDF